MFGRWEWLPRMRRDSRIWWWYAPANWSRRRLLLTCGSWCGSVSDYHSERAWRACGEALAVCAGSLYTLGRAERGPTRCDSLVLRLDAEGFLGELHAVNSPVSLCVVALQVCWALSSDLARPGVARTPLHDVLADVSTGECSSVPTFLRAKSLAEAGRDETFRNEVTHTVFHWTPPGVCRPRWFKSEVAVMTKTLLI